MADKYIDLGYRDSPGGVTPVTVARLLTLAGVTVTKATPGVATKAGHGLVDNDIVVCSGFVEMTELNGKTFLVNQIDANTFNFLDSTGILDTIGFGAAETTGGTVEKVDTALVSPTNEIRLYYDDSFEGHRLIDAVQRAKEALIEIL